LNDEGADFSGLEVKSAAVEQKNVKPDRSRAEQLALEAAERGDVAALQRLAIELGDWKRAESRQDLLRLR
jgi:hypothetical protein